MGSTASSGTFELLTCCADGAGANGGRGDGISDDCWQEMAVRADSNPFLCHELAHVSAKLEFAASEKVQVVRRHTCIQWRSQLLTRLCGLHQVRRYNHHQLCLAFVEGLATEQRPDDRNGPEPRQLLDGALRLA